MVFVRKKKIFFIAEAGVNHNGSVKIAKKMIDVAKNSGADAVKFQTFKAKNLLIKNAPSMKHQKNFNKKISQFEMLKKLEISYKDHKLLKNYCKKKNIIFLSTAFDQESLIFLKSINMRIFKVPSSEMNNFQYLKTLSKFKSQIILSTGMSYMKEIEDTLKFLKKNKQNLKKITLLHCTSEYPAKFKNLNLSALSAMKKKFKINIGYSDHSKGIIAPLIAVGMGCKVIEKHFTLSRAMKGPDHKASLEPKELAELIKNIRISESIFGNGVKAPLKSEMLNRKLARKSIFANKKILKGEKFTEQNLTTKRPGTGIPAQNYFKLIGKKSKKSYNKDDFIN